MELTAKRKEILNKRGIYTDRDILHFLPKDYKDYSKTYKTLTKELDGIEGCFVGTMERLSKASTRTHITCIKFKLFLDNGQKISVNLFGQAHIYASMVRLDGKRVVVAGTLSYSETYGYCISNPDAVKDFSEHDSVARVVPIYKKISGISEETMDRLREEAFLSADLSEKGSAAKMEIVKDLPTYKDALMTLHNPKSLEGLSDALKRLDIEDLDSFTTLLKLRAKKESKTTSVRVHALAKVKSLVDSLPYELTDDQKNAVNTVIKSINQGTRVSCLLQGDVGCGKSIISFLLLMAMAENGYQGVIMAPTSILAKQHFEELKPYADRFGVSLSYFDGTLKAKERTEILKSLKDGSCSLLVGTQAICSADPEFCNLGLVCIDEEHRFGVEQREVLMKYGEQGVNTMLMSATPIPRSLGNAIYGNGVTIFDIKQMPSNRKAVQTAINSNDEVIMSFIEKELKAGRQAYVVCPLIEANEESEMMADVLSVNETYALYKKYFGDRYKVGILNGKLKDEEIKEAIDGFKKRDYDILISTTVVEVGVNVPNASVMVISNAERFGLATLHQLRGRVGRGEYNGYCILRSKDKTNPRLLAMVDYNSGFDIAEMDLKLRGSGETFGTKQSGFTRQMDLVIKYPEEYNRLRA